MVLRGKNILIGVTGSIAAYKTSILIRELVKEGAEVTVVMTNKAKQFNRLRTFATSCTNPIQVDFFNL